MESAVGAGPTQSSEFAIITKIQMGKRCVSSNRRADDPTAAVVLVSVLVFLLGAVAACSKSTQSSEPRPISITSSPSPSFSALVQATATPGEPAAITTAPGAEEVAEAIGRIFNKAAAVDHDRSPVLLVGDFNGDGSQDLAVSTRPNDAALTEINDELANWTLEDPHEVPVPGTKAAAQPTRPKTVKAERSDQLLAIIHGVGPKGWRNPEARQTFLLRNAAGTNVTVQAAAQPRQPVPNSNLDLHGDAISETVKGHRGLIFWTGARYAWAPQP